MPFIGERTGNDVCNVCPLTRLKPGMLRLQSQQLKPQGHKNVPAYLHIYLSY